MYLCLIFVSVCIVYLCSCIHYTDIYIHSHHIYLLSQLQQKLSAAEQARKLHIPPKMQGWLKKKGHIVVNWKTRWVLFLSVDSNFIYITNYVYVYVCMYVCIYTYRYFVLDCGYLTYFVDQQIDGAPYGQDRKGQLCLAGYRVVHSGSTGAGSNNPHDGMHCVLYACLYQQLFL